MNDWHTVQTLLDYINILSTISRELTRGAGSVELYVCGNANSTGYIRALRFENTGFVAPLGKRAQVRAYSSIFSILPLDPIRVRHINRLGKIWKMSARLSSDAQ
jgi:hypothetical protein